MGDLRNLLVATPLKSCGWARWSARVLGLLVAIFLLVIGIGESFSEPFTLTGVGVVILFGWASVSMLIAWRWERLGGLLGILAAIALSIFIAITAGRNKAAAALLIPLPFVVIAAVFLLVSRRMASSPPEAAEGS
jgi:hypothetical protein